eukprot:5004266-Pyramimonas_sp.AAC.3
MAAWSPSTHLPEPPPQGLAGAAALSDELIRAHYDAARGRPQGLGEANARGVGVAQQPRYRHSHGGARVENART